LDTWSGLQQVDEGTRSQVRTQSRRQALGHRALSGEAGRPRWIRGFETQKTAQSELTKLLKSKGDGTYIEPSKQTLSEYLSRWLNTIEANVAPKTFERYKKLVDLNINPKLGTVRMAQLQPVQLAEFYTWAGTEGNRRTKSGLSTRTVLHIHRLLRRALQQAVLWQLRPTNPTDAVQAPRPPDIEMKPVEEERAGWLIVSAEGTDMFLPILTALCTGMRRGEILGIRWSDLGLEQSRLTVNQSVSQTRKQGVFFKSPKKKKSRRTITLPGILMDALREQRIQAAKTPRAVRTGLSRFGPSVAMPDGSVWAPDRRKAVGIRFHDLRRTHASELLRRELRLKP